jgi:hypothetical protein
MNDECGLAKHTGRLEEGDHHDPKKVLAFLENWEPEDDVEEASEGEDVPE